MQGLEGQGGKLKPYTPFNRTPTELFEKFIKVDSRDVWYIADTGASQPEPLHAGFVEGE